MTEKAGKTSRKILKLLRKRLVVVLPRSTNGELPSKLSSVSSPVKSERCCDVRDCIRRSSHDGAANSRKNLCHHRKSHAKKANSLQPKKSLAWSARTSV